MGSILPVSPPIRNARILPIYLTQMTLMKPLIMSSYHFQIHGLGRVMVTNAVVAYDSSNACCGPSLSGAGVAMADGWN